MAPCWHVEVQPPGAQVVPPALVAGGAHQVLELHAVTGKVREGKQRVALALVTRVVDDDQQSPAVAAFPRPGEEGVVGPVAIPGLRRVDEAPCAFAEDGAAQDFQEPLIERTQPFVRRLPGPAYEVWGDAFPAALELALVEKAEAGRQECDDRGRLVHAGREGGGGPRLVVVLEEPSEPALEIEARHEVPPYGGRGLVAQPIV